MSEIIAAVDAGTSGVRSVLFDTDGTEIHREYQEFESIYPKPSWVEQNAEDWWNAASSTLQACISKSGSSAERIAAVAVTNQRETIVPVDESGKPLRNAIVWQDRRTVPQCEHLREMLSEREIYSITGLSVDPYFSAPKILYLKEHEPDTYSETHKFLLVHDFIVHRFCNCMVTDYSNASRTMLFDIENARWSDEILDTLDILPERLPQPVESGTVVGEVTQEASRETGLAVGTSVISGGGDQQCAALGVGVVREGRTKATTGTGTFMLAHTDIPKFDPEMRVLCSRHVVPDAFVVEASMFTTGAALRWFRDNLGYEECMKAEAVEVDVYDVITEEAGVVPAGSEGIIHIPHFTGAGAPHWNPDARAMFAGLALGHNKEHLIRAILEGVSYELRSNQEVMRGLDIPISELRVTGGAARSDVWMQIQSDVLGIPVIRTAMEEATSLGAAILACRGVGIFDSVAEAAEEMVQPLEPLLPRKENQDVYEQGFRRFKRLYNAASDIKYDAHYSL